MVSARSLIPVIVGPTASGKSAAAMALAAHLPLEIISVDSAQVYQGMDIGTAKPDRAERAAVVHHLIDVVTPDDAYSAARFANDAQRIIADVQARDRLPLLVGGTMLYVKALVQGLHDLPAANPVLRAELEAQALQDGWPAMHARLAKLDPVTAARLKPTDSQRLQRALEVCLTSGEAMSTLFARQAARRPDPRFRLIALEPSDRAVLHERIARRFATMLAQGLIEEVQTLRANPRLHAALPALRSVGYRQVWAWLDARQAGATVNLSTLQGQGIAATRQLAKRQLTWLRSMPVTARIDCLAPDAAVQIRDSVARLFA